MSEFRAVKIPGLAKGHFFKHWLNHADVLIENKTYFPTDENKMCSVVNTTFHSYKENKVYFMMTCCDRCAYKLQPSVPENPSDQVYPEYLCVRHLDELRRAYMICDIFINKPETVAHLDITKVTGNEFEFKNI